MTGIPSNIWKVPVYLPYLQPPIIPKAVAVAEKQLGVKLPLSYLALLQEQNGGYVRLTLPDTIHSQIWGVGPYFPSIIRDHWWRRPDAAKFKMWLPQDAALLVPFDGDGHWHLCLDYRNEPSTDEPRVIVLGLERRHENLIAPTFVGFLSMLREKLKRGTWGIVGDHSLDEVLAALERLLDVRFGKPDSFAYGYPAYRCKPGIDKDHQWLWVSKNEVPRGFVRPNEQRYAELKDLMPGTALRMPNRPEVTTIVTCTDDVIDSIEAALARSSLAYTYLGQE